MTNLPQELNARDFLRPIIRRGWFIVAFVVLATVLTYTYYDHQPKIYQASTKLLITASSNPLDPNAAEVTDRTIQDQASLLTSREVATAVARRLGRPESLAGAVTSKATPGSSFIEITASRPTAADSAAVANAFAESFVQLRRDAARARVTKAIDQITAQRSRLPPSERNAAERASMADSVRQLQLMLSASSGSASQVDPALPPAAPAKPRPARNALVALLLSLIGAAGLAFALEALDRRARRLDELADLYDMPVLAVMPHSTDASPSDDDRPSVNPVFKEPLRQLRSNIQLAALDAPFKRILITSAVAGEGKSTVVRNLSLTLREGGLRVAVVDGDLRRPALARMFAHDGCDGLTDVLTGRKTLESSLVALPVQVHGLDTLVQMQSTPSAPAGHAATDHAVSDAAEISLLGSGPLPADPQAVLAADRMRVVLTELSAQHDIVLIDSPPLLPVSDAVALASRVDGIIVVARLGRVTRANARRLAEVLARIPGARPIGIVVNDVPDSESANYGYGYGYGYGRGYGTE